MNRELNEKLGEHIANLGYEDVVYFQGYETAFIGMTVIEDIPRAVYSYDKMIESLMLEDGMDYADAVEWIDFNTIRALPYWGAHAPIVMYDDPDWEWYTDNEDGPKEAPEEENGDDE